MNRFTLSKESIHKRIDSKSTKIDLIIAKLWIDFRSYQSVQAEIDSLKRASINMIWETESINNVIESI